MKKQLHHKVEKKAIVKLTFVKINDFYVTTAFSITTTGLKVTIMVNVLIKLATFFQPLDCLGFDFCKYWDFNFFSNLLHGDACGIYNYGFNLLGTLPRNKHRLCPCHLHFYQNLFETFLQKVRYFTPTINSRFAEGLVFQTFLEHAFKKVVINLYFI